MSAGRASSMRAAVAALSACIGLAGAALPTPPVFPLNWVATEAAVQLDASGQVVMTANVTSCWQQDAQYNRTAYVAANNGISQMFDWDQNVVYQYEGEMCDFWCDISDLEQCDGEDALCSYDYTTGAVYNGTAKVNGFNVNSFTWNETLGPIVMNTLTLYTLPNLAVPVQMLRYITPFGDVEGWFVNNFVSFKAGTPPSTCWNVPQYAYCQEGNDAQCQSYTSTAAAVRKMRALAPSLTTAAFPMSKK